MEDFAAQNMATDTPDFMNTNLQSSIMAAGTQGKTLLCLVTDSSDVSSQWKEVISEEKYRLILTTKYVTLSIRAGSQEATYLSTVCPLNTIPAMIAIKRGAIVENKQAADVTISELRHTCDSLFSSSDERQDHSLNDEGPSSSISQTTDGSETDQVTYLTFSPSAGRMRLPNNAYDALSTRTQKWLELGIKGGTVLKLQLRLLKNIPSMATAVIAIEKRDQTIAPELSMEQQERLLNTPSAALGIDQLGIPPPGSSKSSSSSDTRNSAATELSNTSDTASSSAQHQTQTPREDLQQIARRQQQLIAQQQMQQQRYQQHFQERTASQHRSEEQPSELQRQQEQQTRPELSGIELQNDESQAQQQSERIRAFQEREAAQRAARDQIRASMAVERADRRRIEEDRRKSELNALRQANSTTANPQASDIRIQVRTFDGSTIKTTFPRESSITSQVRPWIDQESNQTIPYNLKLVLTPLPNRNIEASEEEQSLPELGIVGSATLIMVPVKGYVESYVGSGPGIVSAVTGAVGSVLGGIGGLISWGGGAVTTPTTGNSVTPVSDSRTTNESKVRVRTLADQRAEEAKKQGNELYNGNQLNFQGRKDDDNNSDKKED